MCMFQNASEGAQTSVHLAVSEEVEGVSGRYFADCMVLKYNSTNAYFLSKTKTGFFKFLLKGILKMRLRKKILHISLKSSYLQNFL